MKQDSAVPISSVEDIVAEIQAGRMVILVDEEDRENEGDLVMAAQHVTPEAINFMARFGRGLICLTLTRERCEYLKLPPMAAQNGTVYSTAFTVSIEAAEGVTTGISAADRARTIQVAVAKNTQASDLVQPGHVFPLQAVDGGVLMRAGHTEAGCDLAAMAGCSPSAVICEIMNDDGTMARMPELREFAKQHGLRICSVESIIKYRRLHEQLVRRAAETVLPTEHGDLIWPVNSPFVVRMVSRGEERIPHGAYRIVLLIEGAAQVVSEFGEFVLRPGTAAVFSAEDPDSFVRADGLVAIVQSTER